jgi:acyl-CoA thioester hydrolase
VEVFTLSPSRALLASFLVSFLEVPLQERSPKSPRPLPPPIEAFPVRTPDLIRYADIDRQGHVNNAVYSTYFETGRVAIIHHPSEGLQAEGATSVLARIEIDYLRELHWPGTVEVGTGVAGFGRSSYVFVQAVYSAGLCAAFARSTLVLIDRETRKARPLPEVLIARLERLRMKE